MWRGVPEDISSLYQNGKSFAWWGVSSCTLAVSVLESEQYAGSSGPRTMFSIETTNGRVIRSHSYFQQEEEILLPPGIYLKVVDKFKSADGLNIIHLTEVEPPYKMLADPFDLTQLKKSLPKSEPATTPKKPSSSSATLETHTPTPKKIEKSSSPSVTPKSDVKPSPKTSEFKICFKMGSFQQRFQYLLSFLSYSVKQEFRIQIRTFCIRQEGSRNYR